MKKLGAVAGLSMLALVCFSGGAGVMGGAGCTPQEAKWVTQEVLSAADAACVWAHADLPDVSSVKTACSLEAFADVIVQIAINDFFKHQATLQGYIQRMDKARALRVDFPSLTAHPPAQH